MIHIKIKKNKLNPKDKEPGKFYKKKKKNLSYHLTFIINFHFTYFPLSFLFEFANNKPQCHLHLFHEKKKIELLHLLICCITTN